MTLQLCTGHEPLEAVIDRITDDTCRFARGLPRDACRDLLSLIFRTRIRQTTSCGRFEECGPAEAAGAPGEPGVVGTIRPAGWRDPDPGSLPRMFAVAAVDLLAQPPADRGRLERRIAASFRATLAPLLRPNPHCGHSEVCNAPPTYPLDPKRRG